MRTERSISREEAKLLTRRRLLEAAARLLGKTGYGGLSATAVARAAGVAQPTFYVHFRDKDDLLDTLAAEKIGDLRARLRQARARIRSGAAVADIRETFRIPLETLVDNPGIFRLFVQESRQPPGSPLAEHARRLRDELRSDLEEDLLGLGVVSPGGASDEAAIIAESMIAQTEALGLAYVDGRFRDFDALVDVLTRFAVGLLAVHGAG